MKETVIGSTATPESVSNAPKIIRRTQVNDDPYQGSIVIDRAIRTSSAADDPIVELFIASRERCQENGNEALSSSIIPAVACAIGWEYVIFPSNVEDGLMNLAEHFQDYLENRLAPEFEEMVIMFFEDADGYAAYRTCVEEHEFEAANKVIKDFIYRTASKEERKKLDKKAQKKRKEAEKAREVAAKNRNLLKSLGAPTSVLSSMFF